MRKPPAHATGAFESGLQMQVFQIEDQKLLEGRPFGKIEEPVPGVRPALDFGQAELPEKGPALCAPPSIEGFVVLEVPAQGMVDTGRRIVSGRRHAVPRHEYMGRSPFENLVREHELVLEPPVAPLAVARNKSMDGHGSPPFLRLRLLSYREKEKRPATQDASSSFQGYFSIPW